MLTRIQHAAIVSENFVREAKFYEAVLGMKRSKPGSAEEEKAIRTNYAVSISDGYVGVTVIGRKPGYVPGLHHFGIWVDNIETMTRAIETNGGKVHPGPTAHVPENAEHKFRDPYGIVFDISTHGWDGAKRLLG